MALNFNQFAADANHFMDEYAKELMLGEDRDRAGRILSSILKALREIIPMEESIQLIAQLPMFLKAVYVNGWTVKKKTRVKNLEEFVDLVKSYDAPAEINDFGYDTELAEKYIHATFIMLRKYVSQGEIEDIRSGLPKDLKDIMYHRIKF